MELKKNDKAMLLDALKSNGGGINSDLYPNAARARMMRAGLIQWKPNSKTVFVSLLTLTAEGRRVALGLAAEGSA